MKIGYFADGPWSHKALSKILQDDSLQVSFVCARHDKPDQELKRRTEERGLDFFTHAKINSREFLDRMKGYRCDLFVSMSFNQIFCSELINLPPLRTINCHAGKLPYYRGRNVLNWVLINDECEFGITIHYVDDGIDTGDIILQRCYPITDMDDYASLLQRAYDGCSNNLYEVIKMVQRGGLVAVPQKHIHPTGFYCVARKAGDELIVWNQKSREIFNFVRAICRPGPEARTFLGDEEIKINRVEFIPEAPTYKGIVGAVIGVEPGSFLVKTLDSLIRVTEWSGSVKPRIGDRFK